MKVISGSLKGRNILGYSIQGTRPTMDRVKESVFAMIQDHIQNSICLDLFAGSGSLGIEAFDDFVTQWNEQGGSTIQEEIAEMYMK